MVLVLQMVLVLPVNNNNNNNNNKLVNNNNVLFHTNVTEQCKQQIK